MAVWGSRILPTQTIHEKMGHPSKMTSSNSSKLSRRHWTPRYSRCMSPSPSSLGPSLGSSLSSTWTGEEKTSENLISWNPVEFATTTFRRWLAINWMISCVYLGNGYFTKHPFKTGCLGFQALKKGVIIIVDGRPQFIAHLGGVTLFIANNRSLNWSRFFWYLFSMTQTTNNLWLNYAVWNHISRSNWEKNPLKVSVGT